MCKTFQTEHSLENAGQPKTSIPQPGVPVVAACFMYFYKVRKLTQFLKCYSQIDKRHHTGEYVRWQGCEIIVSKLPVSARGDNHEAGENEPHAVSLERC